MGWEYGIQCLESDEISKEQQASELLEQLKNTLGSLDLGNMVIEQVDNGLVIKDDANKEWPHVAQIQIDHAEIDIESVAKGEVYIYCLFHRHDAPIRRMIDTIKEVISTEEQWIEL